MRQWLSGAQRRARSASAGLIAWARRLYGDSSAPYEATRRRLLLLNLSVVSAILLVMAIAVYAAESQALQQQVDQNIINASKLDPHDYANYVQAILLYNQGSGFNLPQDGGGGTGGGYQSDSLNIFTIAIAADGHVVSDPMNVSQVGLPDLTSARAAMLSRDPDDIPTPVTVTAHGQEYRLYTAPLLVPIQGTNQYQVIGALQVGQSLWFMQEQLRDLAIRLLLVGIGMLALTAAASIYLADRALEPMRLAYERQRQFSAAASHELRTPLAFVRSQLELVTRRLQRAAASHSAESNSSLQPATVLATSEEDLRDTLNEVDYMTRLVRDLLLIARDQSDQRSIAREPVDIAELARDVAGTIRPAASERKLKLESRGAQAGIWVDGDRDRLRQLLLILLENATHYTPEGGSIWIETRQTRSSRFARRRPLAQVIVGDTGVGIAPTDQPRIFEAFYRAEGHNDGGNHSGAGLGLALAKWIVSAHQGEITVSSQRGAGSVFTISLPERQTQIAREDEEASVEASAPQSDVAHAGTASE
jgi:signal transduction histidine kinase